MRRALARIASRLPGGPEGNRRLTALLGALLLLGLGAEFLTLVLGLQQTLLLHVFVGVALIPIVALKLGSTGWRMVRYYAHAPEYRAGGPPRPLLRALAPVLVGSTIALLGSGVGLVVAGPQVGFFRAVHGASFALFTLLIGVHVVAHLPKLRRSAFADFASAGRHQGHALRSGLVAFALVAGGAIAIAAVEQAEPWATAIRHGFGG